MSVFKKLAGETALYGMSSILARLVNFLLVPLHTHVFTHRDEYGVIGQVYAWIALGIILYTLRLESAYFRYSSNDPTSTSYANAKSSVTVIALFLSFLLFISADLVAGWLQIPGYGQLVRFGAGIIAIDAICELPFARLRLEKRPVKFVTIKIINILINVFLNYFLLWWAPKQGYAFFTESNKIVYVFLANLAASVVTLLLLSKEYFTQGFELNKKELIKIFSYALPLFIVGIAAVMNDSMTRQFLGWLVPGTSLDKQTLMGEYNACVKFGVFISLFVQAFRYAAEPFFFKHMHSDNARLDYSRITTYFTQFMMIGFVAILLYLDFIKHYVVRTPSYLNAIGVVPIVLLANVFLGVYYNVSNWYRLTDRTRYGMYSAMIGVGLTILFNVLLVPRFNYYGTAWSMLICYLGMTVVTYLWGQKYYPVPYEVNKILWIILGGIFIYVLSKALDSVLPQGIYLKLLIHSVLFGLFVLLFNRDMVKSLIVSFTGKSASNP
ncbi:MAG: polysaccharide biosynthesis C-terminal domain-containing protein, partial [Saprospiraceae bacterium]